MSKNRLFLSGEENEKSESTRRSGSPPKVNHFQRVTSCCQCLPSLVDVRFRVRQLCCLQNDRTNERMTENDHITSALLTEVIIICYRPSDRVKIDRQDIFNQQNTERAISPIFKTPSLVSSIENGISDICCFRSVIPSPYNCSQTSMEVLTLIFAVLLPFLLGDAMLRPSCGVCPSVYPCVCHVRTFCQKE